jgi:serine/threonine protein kinase
LLNLPPHTILPHHLNLTILAGGTFGKGLSGIKGENENSVDILIKSKGKSGTGGDHPLRFLVFPAVHLALTSILPLILNFNGKYSDKDVKSDRHVKYRDETDPFDRSGAPLSPILARELCRDLFSAVNHCIQCGVYFQWISLDQIFITSDGRLQLGGLNGAVLSSSMVLSEKEKEKHREREKDNGQSTLPSLVTTSLEIIMGAKPSPQTSVWAVGAVCVHIISGKPLIKAGSSDEKHLQYMYCTSTF